MLMLYLQAMLECALGYRKEFVHVFLEGQLAVGQSWTGWLERGKGGVREDQSLTAGVPLQLTPVPKA